MPSQPVHSPAYHQIWSRWYTYLLVQASACTLAFHTTKQAKISPEHLLCLLPAQNAVDAPSQHPAVTEPQSHVIDVLVQQLAEQHIPLSLPLTPLMPSSQPGATSNAHDQTMTKPDIRLALLDRFLADAASSCNLDNDTTCSSTSTTQVVHQHLPDRLHMGVHVATQLDTTSQLETVHEHKPVLPSPLATLQLPAIAASFQHNCCWHHIISTASSCNRCCSAAGQSAEVLVVRSSKGQTWKGLALRQAFLGRDAAQRDGEASVQDAAGGGGLLHGGAEDGGEGGGPSRCHTSNSAAVAACSQPDFCDLQRQPLLAISAICLQRASCSNTDFGFL